MNCKNIFKIYHRHYELVSKFMARLNPPLEQGLLEPEFYGDLVYKLNINKMFIELFFLINSEILSNLTNVLGIV